MAKNEKMPPATPSEARKISSPAKTKARRPLRRDIQAYYETSNNELAQRYIKREVFPSKAYAEAALRHRYQLYPFIEEFVDFDAWRGKSVLEIGSGQGADLSEFVRHGAHCWGYDITFKHCRMSRDFVSSLGGGTEVIQGDASVLPFRSESFDLVYSFGVLLLVQDLDAAAREIHRVLKPGGSVIAMFYNRESLHYYLKTLSYYGVVCDLQQLLGTRRLIDWFTDGFGYPRTHHHDKKSLRGALEQFRIDEIVVRNLTPEQTPLLDRSRYPEAFWQWLSSRLGFYLLLRGTK